MNTEKWLKENTRSLKGKRVAISGATGGIGRALCRYFALLGAEIWMLDRNSEKSEAHASELKKEFPELSVRHIRLDLSDIQNVKEVTELLLSDTPDHLILGAGAYHVPRFTCGLGYNNIFQINYISPYFMARSLLEKIKARDGRIVAVGSIAHNYSKSDMSDIDFSKKKSSALVYGNAKRYLMFSMTALSDSTAAIAHPGITLTGITAHYPKIIFALIKHPMKIIFMKPETAALSVLYPMFNRTPPHSWTGPKFFGIWGKPKNTPLTKISISEENDINSTAESVFKGMLG